MKIPLSWLKEYIDLDVDVDSLCEKMTMLGLEIEGVENLGEEIQGVVVGQIVSAEPHPDADRLQVCKTDVGGDEPLQIVCGATNFKVGDRVPTATVGGSLPGFAIGKRKMRGVQSFGMMCSAKELGLGDDHSGLLILDADAPLGADAKELLGLDEVVLEIEVTPNRGDWAGLIGIARELAAAYGKELKLPALSLNESGGAVNELSSVEIEAPDLCPRYAGRVIQGVTIGPSPEWLAKRLIAAGQRPINNVVDVTNYVLLETGHPLHAFDMDKLNEKRIVVRRATSGEKITTIDQEERTLDDEMLVIADAKVPVAIAGVMGGFDSEVGDDTKDIFLESAYFHPPSIRRTSRALNLISEASQRFQRGADLDMVLFAADRAAQLFVETAGGTIAPGILDEYPKEHEKATVSLNFERTEQFLGTPVPNDSQVSMLESLGFETVDKADGAATFSVPLRRYDVSNETDLIEEVARLHGYENIPASLPRVHPMEARVGSSFERCGQLRSGLLSAGLTEAMNWTFCSADDLGWNWRYGSEGWIRLENYLSERHAGMRPSLIPGLLRTVSDNLRKGRGGVAMMEIGPAYGVGADGRGAKVREQSTNVAIAIGGRAQGHHFTAGARDYDLYDLMGYLEFIEAEFGVSLEREAGQIAQFTASSSASLVSGKNALGVLGEVSPEVCAALDVEHFKLYVLELDVTAWLAGQDKKSQFTPVPKHPAAQRDLAVIVGDDIPVGTIQETVQKAGGKRLSNVQLFDVYTGKPIPEGQRSLAFSLTLQSPDKTLTDKEIDKAVKRIVKTLENEHGAQLR